MIRIVCLLVLVFIGYFLLSVPNYSGDVKNHLVWADSILKHGPYGFYGREFPGFSFPNYPPLMMFLFSASLQLYRWVNQLVWFLNINIPFFPSRLVYFIQWENTQIAFMKLPAMIANLGIGVAIYKLYEIIKSKKNFLSLLIFLLNPAAIYLSVIWGQVDYLPVMFFLFALLLLYKKRKYLSITLVLLALLSKQTIIIFVPVYLFIYWKMFGLKTLTKGLLLMVGLFYLFYLPFHSFNLLWPIGLYKLNFSLVAPSVAEDAINFWGAVSGFKRVFDGNIMFGLSFQYWGYILFILAMIVPILKFLKKYNDKSKLLSFLFIIAITYFMTLTRMHERYLASSIALLSLLVLLNKKFWVGLAFFTFLHFINLYRGLYEPGMPFINYLLSSNIFLQCLVLVYAIIIFCYTYNFCRKD